MRFRRNIILLSVLVLILAGILVALQQMRRHMRLGTGWRIFPVDSASVVGIRLDFVAGEPDLAVVRDGDTWRMKSPYDGLFCDAAAVAELLDGALGMRVSAVPGDLPEEPFQEPFRTLTLELPDGAYTAKIGTPLPMCEHEVQAETDGRRVILPADQTEFLPKSADALRTSVLVPLPADRVSALEWRAPGIPFTAAVRRPSGNWSVIQPIPFEVRAETVRSILEGLCETPSLTYAETHRSASEGNIAEPALAGFGLDDESALRLSVRIEGGGAPLSFRFGAPVPGQPETCYCLIEGAKTVVAVPKSLRDAFGAEGPFVTDFRNLPVFGDISGPTRIRLAPRAGTVTELKRSESGWELLLPVRLTAAAQTVEAYCRRIFGLTGDAAKLPEGGQPPRTQLTFYWGGGRPSVTASFYEDPAHSGMMLVRRDDTGRVYRVSRDRLPSALLADGLDVALVDRTVLSLPAAAVRRIADGTSAVAVAQKSRRWETVSPAGAYLVQPTVDALLTLLADLRAVRVMAALASGPEETVIRYGLDEPVRKLTFDLTGSDALRRILLIGRQSPVTGNAALMVQGRPIVYEVDAEAYAVLTAPLTEPPESDKE